MNPTLYQVNVRAWLYELSDRLGKPCQLDDIPDADLDQIAEYGFDWLWLLGVWQTGPEGMRIARQIPELRDSYRNALPDLQEQDITGSTFAIQDYTVHADFGGNAALEKLRRRLSERSINLLLDFVPNHTALDHPWISEHSNYYVQGVEGDLQREPGNYTRVTTNLGGRIVAHGRDPYFPGWTDTAQLNYGNPELQLAMRRVLEQIATMCDGVRCDMAMLVLSEVFRKTWGIDAAPFWAAAVEATRAINPEFRFVAEVYWGLEGKLQQQGFDYTYDKSLYDHLVHRDVSKAQESLEADVRYQGKMARFLENHDEPRAAATFPFEIHRAAAVITYLTPGMRFFHEGQLRGAVRMPSIQLRRRFPEPANDAVQEFYKDLLRCVREGSAMGEWVYLWPLAAWEGNWTSDCFVCFAWHAGDTITTLIAVNFSDHDSQCYVKLPFAELNGNKVVLRDRMSPAAYEREGSELIDCGLYLDMPAWRYHVFVVEFSNSN